jgi:uncharacterized protein (DUF2345 family)
MVLEAGTELTGKAGGSWIKLDASGVHIDGHRIDLGAGGSPGNGSETQPKLPIPPELVDKYVGDFVVTHQGETLANIPYRITMKDGVVATGITDAFGRTSLVVEENKESLTLLLNEPVSPNIC